MEKKKINTYEVYCENFSQIILSFRLGGAVSDFENRYPEERVIFAEDVAFRSLEKASVEYMEKKKAMPDKE